MVAKVGATMGSPSRPASANGFTPGFFSTTFIKLKPSAKRSFATLATEQYEEQPIDLRGSIDRAAAQAQAEGWARLAKRTEENYARLRANKVTITTADPVDPALHKVLAAAASTAIATWKRDVGPEAAALIS